MTGSSQIAMPDVIHLTESRELRTVLPSELSSLETLYAELHEGEPPFPRDVGEILTLIQTTPGRRIYGLSFSQDRDNLVAAVDVFVVRGLTRGGKPWVGIENFVVREACRRRGHGSAVLEAIVQFAKGIGAYKVQFISAESRSDAHRLYVASGFVVPVRGFRRYV
jgi:GNAT superfamily N-acetyltransferase